MADDLKRLEALVARAADRLRTTTEERGALQRQIDDLRRELETRPGAAGDEDGGWEARRGRITAALRETLEELRGEREHA